MASEKRARVELQRFRSNRRFVAFAYRRRIGFLLFLSPGHAAPVAFGGASILEIDTLESVYCTARRFYPQRLALLEPGAASLVTTANCLRDNLRATDHVSDLAPVIARLL